MANKTTTAKRALFFLAGSFKASRCYHTGLFPAANGPATTASRSPLTGIPLAASEADATVKPRSSG